MRAKQLIIAVLVALSVNSFAAGADLTVFTGERLILTHRYSSSARHPAI
jgi:hypothetical protein